VGLVDGDIGQASIEPPTTVGLAIFRPNDPLPPDPSPLTVYFVGSTSPPGHFLPLILGTQSLVQAAIAQGVEIVLVDTTGLILGAPAASLKWHKLQALRPQHVLALQSSPPFHPWPRKIKRLDASGGVSTA
jgi:polynucleotide 5'-hydroxyl-kinase GRC3/NOL9